MNSSSSDLNSTNRISDLFFSETIHLFCWWRWFFFFFLFFLMNWINFNPLPKFFKNENVKSSCKEDCSRIQSSSLKGKSWRSQDLFKSFREISKRQVHNENLEPTQTTKTNTLSMNEWLSKLGFFLEIYIYTSKNCLRCVWICVMDTAERTITLISER